MFDEISGQNLGIFRIILASGLIYEALRINKVIPIYYLNPEFFIKWDFFQNIPIFKEAILYNLTYILFFSSIFLLIGFLFRFFSLLYLSIYVYFILIEASYYNNHYYFISLLIFILFFTKADNCFSVKNFIQRKRNKVIEKSVPRWNYSILKFQIFIAYFLAGIVKLNFAWLSTNTFRCVMDYGTEYPKDSLFYHSNFGIYFLTFGGVFFDLIVPLMLLTKRWRLFAIPAILTFHTINAATLNIGVFPYLMAGCTIVFYKADIVDYWKKIIKNLNVKMAFRERFSAEKLNKIEQKPFSPFVFYFLIVFVVLQLLIPYRHLLIPGNVGWTGEGNSFSWRMKMGLKAPTRFELFVHNKYTGMEYKPQININPHQYSSLWICPNRIIQVANFVALRTSKQFNVSVDSLTINCKTDLIFNNHPSSPLYDTTVNLLEVKLNKWGHTDFITKLPTKYPQNQYYWLSFLND